METRKEKVEGMVRHSRANFLVPVPQVRTLDKLKAGWEESCRGDLGRRPRGQGRRKEALSLEDVAAMRGLPEAEEDATTGSNTAEGAAEASVSRARDEPGEEWTRPSDRLTNGQRASPGGMPAGAIALISAKPTRSPPLAGSVTGRF